jgi:hypothetical protein
MKRFISIATFLLLTESCMAHKDSMSIRQTRSLDTTLTNDGWDDDSWNPEPLPKPEPKSPKQQRQEKRQERREQRQENRETNPSNFPPAVAWSSVALAALGIIKILLQSCKP